MIILAYDLATTTGVAFGDTGATPFCETVRLDSTPNDHSGRFYDAMAMAKRHLIEIKPDVVAIEKPIVAGPVGKQARVLVAVGLRGVIFGMARAYGIRDIREYEVKSVRSHFLGEGNLQRARAKARTMDHCAALGWPATNDDEADACAVWQMARFEMTGQDVGVAGGLFVGG